MKQLKHILLLLLAGLQLTAAHAQVYPVQVSPVIHMPYPAHLSDYANTMASAEQMQLLLTLTDVNEFQRQVRLEVSIKGNNITAKSRQIINGATPIYLDGGVPLRLSTAELAPYFKLENLEGISAQAYARQLPAGIYSFCFTVYDYLSGQRLSNTTCRQVQIILYEPPILNLPQNHSNIVFSEPQNIVFNWTPRHIGAFNTEYELSLVEIWDNSAPSQAVFLASPPLYTATTTATSMVYGPADPLLIEGKTYAWRIQAKAKQGIDYISLFENEGYSEIFTFTLEEPCQPVTNATAQAKLNSATINFDSQPRHQSHTLYLRPAESTGRWYSYPCNGNTLDVSQLRAGTTYQYYIESWCGSNNTVESQTFTFTTPEKEYARFENCGQQGNEINISNTTPLSNLYPGDVFTAGGHKITVISASGTNGNFTGTGYAEINFMGETKVAVEFEGIAVNTDFELFRGMVQTTYDENESGIIDIDQVVDDINDEIAGGNDQGNATTTDDLVDFTISQAILNTDALQYNTETGELTVIVGTTPTTYNVSDKIPDDGILTIKDSKGDAYTIDTQTGKVEKMGTVDKPGYLANGADNRTVSGTFAIVRFAASDNAQYAFDPHGTEYTSNFSDETYGAATITVNGKQENVAFKLIPEGQTDKVKAIITPVAAGFDASKIVYRTIDKSQELQAPNGSTTHELTLKAGQTRKTIELHALYPNNDKPEQYDLLGKLMISTYTPINKQVVLVPMPGAKVSVSNIKEELTGIYKSFGVNLSVTSGSFKSYRQYLGDGKLDVTGTGRFTRYSDEMKALNRGFKTETSDYDNNTFYVFLFSEDSVNFSENIGALAGDMPRGQQFGYVFVPSSGGDQVGATIAHELGHGIFKLQHTFSDSYNITEKTTQNLMDYSGGKQLVKPQWDMLFDTGIAGFWDGDEEGAFVFGETAIENIVRAVRNIRCAKANNTETTNLYFSNYSYTIKIKDLITAFNWAGSDVSNEKISFYISNNGEINLNYFEDDFNVNAIQYNDSKNQVVLKGKKQSLFIEPFDAYSDHKTQVYSFIKTLFDGGISISEPTSAEINGMGLDELRYLSVCQLALMSDDKRRETLRSISEQTAITAKDEKLVLNLLKTTKSPSAIYSLLSEDQVSYKLFKALNTYNKEFIFLFNWICEAGWTDAEKQNAEVIFLGINDKGVRYQLAEQSWMFDKKEENKIPVWNLEDLGCSDCLSKKFNSSPAAPIKIAYFDGNNRTVSTLLVDYLREQENKEEWTDAFVSYLSGVGLSSAGRVMLTKSTPKIVKFLALVEFGKTSIDMAFMDDGFQQELIDSGHDWFVENWTTISISLDMITFGSEMIVKFATKGDDLSAVMRAKGKTKAADEAQRITDEAKAMLDNAGDLGGSLAKADILINNLSRELRDFATNFKLAGKVETLPDGTTLVLKADNGDELGRIVNNKLEITDEQIVKIQKGYRPNPYLYMSETDITNHLNKFESEGVVSRVVLKEDYEDFGVGKPDAGKTEFVSTKSEIDDILKLPLTEQSKKLGLPESQLQGGGIVRIDFKLSSKYKVEIPSGNEWGTNEQWIPGGKLPDGNLEAIIKTEGMVEGVDFNVIVIK